MVAVGSKSVPVSNNTAVGTPLVGMTGNAVFIGFDEHGVVIFGVLIEQARLDEGSDVPYYANSIVVFSLKTD